MAESVQASWPAADNAPTRSDRLGGPYATYRPDRLMSRPLVLDRDIGELAAQVERAVRRLGRAPGAHGLEGLARFLLRSEAIASSRIEGMEVSPQQVGLAELVDEESLTAAKVNRTARRVAANIAALRRATTELADVAALDVAGIDALHAVLLADEPELHGLRTVQNWIGGSAYHPIGADFVPPDPTLVPNLMADLADYLNTGGHSALVQAGLAHAQFETIHPFKDGNGRVGRALIHTVLVRRGLTSHAVLPISPVLLTRCNEYVAGLTAYRYVDVEISTAAQAAQSQWLRCFLQAVAVAVEQAAQFATDLADLQERWATDLAAHRRREGIREVPRADSATARILATLQEHPVLTTPTVMRLFELSQPPAGAALEELAAAGVLTGRKLGRAKAYLATDVFDLITFAERRLASTRWDTAAAAPSRPAPHADPAG
jgi:Fic family protein